MEFQWINLYGHGGVKHYRKRAKKYIYISIEKLTILSDLPLYKKKKQFVKAVGDVVL